METTGEVSAEKSSIPITTKLKVSNGSDRLENVTSGSPNSDSCTCHCGFQNRLEQIEIEMNDLKSWKAERQQLDDILSQWKEEVGNWMQTTFGFSFSCSIPTANGNEEKNTSNQDISNEAQNLHERDDIQSIDLNLGESEDVEITPDLFGHFLLDNEYDHGEGDDVQEVDDNISDEEEEEEEDEVPDTINVPSRRRSRRNKDSDSECYTISSSSSSEEYTSSDEEYEPLAKKARGRGGRKQPRTQVSGITARSLGSNHKNFSINRTENGESKNELLKYCRKRQGNIWECTACGFMLTSYDNMLLHIKYNHSSSTHTCPYCRVVVLCRSPKDAIMHQSQCKMRPPTNTSTKSQNPSVIQPAQKISATTTVIKNSNKTIPIQPRPPPKNIKDINAEIDKMVDDLLEPGPSSQNNGKNIDTPAIVTLSSDED